MEEHDPAEGVIQKYAPNPEKMKRLILKGQVQVRRVDRRRALF